MLYLSKEVASQLNYFRTADGREALLTLGKLLYDEHAKQAVLSDGNAIYREQGKAQLANWLINLPQGLNDAANATPEPMDKPA